MGLSFFAAIVYYYSLLPMNILSIELITDYNDQLIVHHPCVIQNGEDVILVDCSYEGASPLIAQELDKQGINISDLTGLIISHDDIDHVGSLHELRKAFPLIRIYASRAEIPYISGQTTSLRLLQAESMMKQMPDEQKSWAMDFIETLRAIKRVPVDEALEDTEDLPEGLEIFPTPGHTPGHISLYVPSQKIFIANDALVFENGELHIANPGFCLDLPEAVRSVQKIAALPIDKLLCYHGGWVTGDIAGMLQNLIDRYASSNA
jgi:glyoxylase-like metal-dependent hydrolase (beta-lactamase superfamily II)